MNIGNIENATRTLEAPAGWDPEKQGECGALPIRDEMTSAGPAMTSAWHPSQEEILAIACGAPVHLTVFGNGHPPVALGVGPQPATEPANDNPLAALHNKLVAPIVKSILAPAFFKAGHRRDALILLESVIVGVIIAICKLGGDEPVLDKVIERVKERLAEQRLREVEPAGSA